MRTTAPTASPDAVSSIASETPMPLLLRASWRSSQRRPASFVSGAGTVVTFGMYGSRLASTTVGRSDTRQARSATTSSASAGSGYASGTVPVCRGGAAAGTAAPAQTALGRLLGERREDDVPAAVVV